MVWPKIGKKREINTYKETPGADTEEGQYASKKRGLRRNQTTNSLIDLRLLASRTETIISQSKPPSLWYFVGTAGTDEHLCCLSSSHVTQSLADQARSWRVWGEEGGGEKGHSLFSNCVTFLS